MKLTRTALLALATSVLLLGLVGCSLNPGWYGGATGNPTVDGLTGMNVDGNYSGANYINNLTAVTLPTVAGGQDGRVRVSLYFKRPIADATVVSGRTLIVSVPGGAPIPGTISTGAVANDQITLWTSDSVFRAGGTYAIQIIGTDDGTSGAILSWDNNRPADAVDADGVDYNNDGVPNGNGQPGGNCTVIMAAP